MDARDVQTFPTLRTDRWPRDRYEAALKLTRPGKRALDIGCASGTLLYNLRGDFESLCGVDILTERVDQASNALASVDVQAIIRQADLGKGLPFEVRSFDAVYLMAVLEFVPDLFGAVKTAASVLVPGGRLIVTEPNFVSLKRRANLMLGRFPGTSVGDQGFALPPDAGYDRGTVHYFTWATLERTLSLGGLDLVERVGYGKLGRVHNLWRPLLSSGIAVAAIRRE